MVELLDPQPGQRVLELAAGPGEVGFAALPRLQPGGELISTDVAPEMVDAARRRAEELGLDGVRFAVEDAADAVASRTTRSTRVLCRFGIMLVPDMERAAAEMARVTAARADASCSPSGRARQLNPWITASGRAALELGLTEPPDPDAPGPFRLADAERLRAVVASRRARDRARRGGAGDLGGRLARRVVGDDAGHLAHADAAARAALGRTRSTALRQARERHCSRSTSRRDGSLTVPGVARVVVGDGPRTERPLEDRLAERARGQLDGGERRRVLAVEDRVHSTTSNEPTIPDSAISSQARWASR